MNSKHSISKRQFLISLGSLGAGAVLNSCADMGQLGGLGNIGLGPGMMPTILIKPQMMMTKIAPRFPYQKDYQGLIDLNFSDPVLSMVPNADKVRVGLTTLGGLRGGGRQIGGRCQIACGLHYDPKTRGIFLKDSVLEDFSIAGIPNQLTAGLRDVANLIGKNLLESYPVYTLEKSAGLGFLKKMNVTDNGILLSFGI